MTLTKYYIIALLIPLSISSCRSQDSKTAIVEKDSLPYLTKELTSQVANKQDKLILYGDIASHTTEGEFKLNRILIDSTNPLTADNMVELCISILQNENLYHLHERAGIELAGLTESIELDKWLSSINENRFEYILLRSNHLPDKVLYLGRDFSELNLGNQQAFFKIIGNDRLGQKTKKYFIEALYSLTIAQKTGEAIYKTLSELNLEDNLKECNDSLYQAFQQYKPQFERLDAIHTWKEMDKNTNAIKEMFENTHPIMFLQLLSFNPSTVLESKKLSQLKQDALIEIMNNADHESFYDTYRLAYLNELLVDRNYSVRFLDKVMSNKEKQDFIKELEKKNTVPHKK